MNESYIQKAFLAPDAIQEMVLVSGTQMYLTKINEFINVLLEVGYGIDAPLVLVALEKNAEALRQIMSEKACEIADMVGEKTTVLTVNLAELVEQAKENDE